MVSNNDEPVLIEHIHKITINIVQNPMFVPSNGNSFDQTIRSFNGVILLSDLLILYRVMNCVDDVQSSTRFI